MALVSRWLVQKYPEWVQPPRGRYEIYTKSILAGGRKHLLHAFSLPDTLGTIYPGL